MTTGTSTGENPTRESIDRDARIAWVALALIPGLGARRLAALISAFGSAEAAIHAPNQAIVALDGFTVRAAAAIRAADLGRADVLLAAAADAGQLVLIPSDPDYPARLRSIPDPPPMLFVRGNPGLFGGRAVAIVGSRTHTRYGAEVALELARTAVEAGAVVVSGMALGLDAIAQTAALDAGGTTIGVLGTPVDVIYPTSNRKLFERTLATGCLLSEYPTGTRGHPGAFPRRNRLISGLADVLVVVEAAEASGTLITVNCALEQGRDVLAVPGPITAATSRGTNRLIRDGATPILEPDDLRRALGVAPSGAAATPAVAPCTLSPDEARVFDALSTELRHLDDLAEAVGIPIGALLGTLLGLELGGLVEQLPGSHFRVRVS